MSVSTLYPPPFFKQFVPQKSGLHRQAVFALYRAILTQCNATPFDDTSKNALRNIAHNRFHANRHLRSPRRLKLAFYAGYKALDYLDGAVAGDKASAERIATYLAKVPDYLRKCSEAKPLPPKPNDPPYITPPEHQFFNVFPREKVKGVRKVPIFVRASGLPMVRWKKPQPDRLSRTIRQLAHAKHAIVEYQLYYEEYYVPMAQREDFWDELTRQGTGEEPDEEDVTWTSEANQGLQYIKQLSKDRHNRMMEKAHMMVQIVEQEQQLADKEQAEREKAYLDPKNDK